MKNQHLSEKDIQQYSFDKENCHSKIIEHFHFCEACRAKVKVYQLAFERVKGFSKPVLDFDLSASVLAKITPEKSIPAPSDSWFYSVITTCGILLIFLFWKYVGPIFAGITRMGLSLIITSALIITVFLIVDSYKKHFQKMKKLDLL